MVGGMLSTTVTLKEQVCVPFEFPVLVQVTVVTPRGKLEPDGGVQVTGWQTPDVIGAKVTVAAQVPAATFVVMFPGQVSVQGGVTQP